MASYIKLVLGVLMVVQTTWCHPEFMDSIPNGNAVPHPCERGNWAAVGHMTPNYTPQKNVFGRAFHSAGNRWTRQLCMQDSDGDGQTNGEELGDPNCNWRPGATAERRAQGHPGICEPHRRGCTSRSFFEGCTRTGQGQGHGQGHGQGQDQGQGQGQGHGQGQGQGQSQGHGGDRRHPPTGGDFGAVFPGFEGTVSSAFPSQDSPPVFPSQSQTSGFRPHGSQFPGISSVMFRSDTGGNSAFPGFTQGPASGAFPSHDSSSGFPSQGQTSGFMHRGPRFPSSSSGSFHTDMPSHDTLTRVLDQRSLQGGQGGMGSPPGMMTPSFGMPGSGGVPPLQSQVQMRLQRERMRMPGTSGGMPWAFGGGSVPDTSSTFGSSGTFAPMSFMGSSFMGGRGGGGVMMPSFGYPTF